MAVKTFALAALALVAAAAATATHAQTSGVTALLASVTITCSAELPAQMMGGDIIDNSGNGKIGWQLVFSSFISGPEDAGGNIITGSQDTWDIQNLQDSDEPPIIHYGGSLVDPNSPSGTRMIEFAKAVIHHCDPSYK